MHDEVYSCKWKQFLLLFYFYFIQQEVRRSSNDRYFACIHLHFFPSFESKERNIQSEEEIPASRSRIMIKIFLWLQRYIWMNIGQYFFLHCNFGHENNNKFQFTIEIENSLLSFPCGIFVLLFFHPFNVPSTYANKQKKTNKTWFMAMKSDKQTKKQWEKRSSIYTLHLFWLVWIKIRFARKKVQSQQRE